MTRTRIKKDRSLARRLAPPCALILWAGLAGCSKTHNEASASRGLQANELIVEPKVNDLGTFWRGPEVEATFTLRNPGATPIRVTAIQADCGCLGTLQAPFDVPPGDEQVFPVRLKSDGLKNDFTRSITLETSAGPPMKLQIKGHAKPRFDVQPPGVSFGRHYLDAQLSREVHIKNLFDTPTPITLKNDESNQFKASLLQINEREYRLTISTNPPLHDKINGGDFVLETGMEDYPTVNVHVSAYGFEKFDCYPRILVYQPGLDDQVIRLKYAGPDSLEMVTPRSNVRDVKFTTLEMSHGHEYMIKVRFDENFVPKIGDRIVLDIMGHDDIIIPIRALGAPVSTSESG